MNRETEERLRRYVERANAVAPLSREEELELVRRYQASGDAAARDALLRAHLRYVVAIALKYRRYRVPLDELIAEGNLGAVYALGKFDAGRGTRFVTYAAYWIRAHVLNYVIRSWSLVSGGSSALRSKVFFKIRRERARIANFTSEPEEAERALAQALGLPTAKVAAWVQRLEARDVSLDGPVDGRGVALAETLIGSDPSQERLFFEHEERSQLRQALDGALGGLDERERFIVERRLMAHGDDELSLTEIGRRLGISRERARQLEARAKRKLRDRLEHASREQGGWLSEMVAA